MRILLILSLMFIFGGCATTERFAIYKCPQCNDMIYLEIPTITKANYLYIDFAFDNEETSRLIRIQTKDAKEIEQDMTIRTGDISSETGTLTMPETKTWNMTE